VSVYENLKKIVEQYDTLPELGYLSHDTRGINTLGARLQRAADLAREALRAWEPRTSVDAGSSPFGELLQIRASITKASIEGSRDPRKYIEYAIEEMLRDLKAAALDTLPVIDLKQNASSGVWEAPKVMAVDSHDDVKPDGDHYDRPMWMPTRILGPHYDKR